MRWDALEQEDEEEEYAVELGDGEVDVEDHAVCSVDAEAQQHDADAGFDGHATDDEDGFTEPPEL